MVEFVEDEMEGDVLTFSKRTKGLLCTWGAILLSIVIMLSHWYIFYEFSHNTQEVLYYPESNEMCIAWIYGLIYLVIPVALVLVTFSYKWINLFKIPFVYFVFVNIERWYYGSWFCTNEMIDTHYILIYCILCIYAMEIIGIMWKSRKNVIQFPKKVLKYIASLKRGSSNKKDDNYDGMINMIEGGNHVKA